MALPEGIVVYSRSPSETWVYDSQPELGIGVHILDQPELERLLELGTRLIRFTLYWDQAAQDPAYAQSWRDQVRAAHDRGLEVIAVVHGGDGQGYTWRNRQQGYQAYAAFVGRAAADNPNVRYWELFNEQNLGFGTLFGQHLHDGNKMVDRWVPYTERGEHYVEMLRLAYPAIKQANPEAWVVMGGLAGSVEPTAEGNEVLDFLEGVYRAGGRELFDVMNIHTYGVPLITQFAANGRAVRQVMARHGDDKKPLVNTEFGISGNNILCAWNITDTNALDRIQTEQLLEVLDFNAQTRLYWKVLPYQLYAEAEMNECERSRAAVTAERTARFWNDYSAGWVRFDRPTLTPRPVFRAVQARGYNRALRTRVLDVPVAQPEQGIILHRNVTLDPRFPTRLR